MRKFPQVDRETVNSFFSELLNAEVDCVAIPTFIGRHQVFALSPHRLVVKVFHLSPEKRCRTEKESILFLQKQLIPSPAFFDCGDSLGGVHHWLLQSMLSGSPADSLWAQQENQFQRSMVTRLAEVLARIHIVPEAALPPLKNQSLPSRLLDFSSLAAKLPADMSRIYDTARETLGSGVSTGRRPLTFVHRDFSLRNVMTSHSMGDANIEGIIDFERAFLGDPMEDVATVLLRDLWSTPALTSLFVETYKSKISDPKFFNPEVLRCLMITQLLEITSWAKKDDFEYYSWAKELAMRIVSDERWEFE